MGDGRAEAAPPPDLAVTHRTGSAVGLARSTVLCPAPADEAIYAFLPKVWPPS